MKPETIDQIRLEAQRVQEDAIHSAKGHYNAADLWGKVNYCIGIPNTVFAAVAGVSAFEGYPVLAGVLASLVAVSTAVYTFVNPADRAATYRRCAGDYLTLRNEARVFSNIDLDLVLDEQAAMSRFSELLETRNTLNSTSPQIPMWAFRKAKTGIDAGESTYRS